MRSLISGARTYLIVSNKLSELQRVSDWVNEWALQHQLPTPIAQKLDLCSTEVVTNVISYAYEDKAVHQIVLRLQWHDSLISLEVEDDGKPFNPLEAPAPAPIASLEDARIGGWGIPILRSFSDELRYRRANGKNRLTVIQRCSTSSLQT
jgi:serine/threonine-protein kinase RsbW